MKDHIHPNSLANLRPFKRGQPSPNPHDDLGRHDWRGLRRFDRSRPRRGRPGLDPRDRLTKRSGERMLGPTREERTGQGVT